MTKYLLVLLCLIITGCSFSEKEIKTYRLNRVERISREIVYFYDPRTDLCFAYYNAGSRNGLALTVVPYEKVKDHLVNPPNENLVDK